MRSFAREHDVDCISNHSEAVTGMMEVSQDVSAAAYPPCVLSTLVKVV